MKLTREQLKENREWLTKELKTEYLYPKLKALYAKKQHFSAILYYGKYYCGYCGEEINSKFEFKEVCKCKKCKHNNTYLGSRGKTTFDNSSSNISIVKFNNNIVQERIFLVGYNAKAKQHLDWKIEEVARKVYCVDNSNFKYSRKAFKFCSYYVDSFNFESALRIRNDYYGEHLSSNYYIFLNNYKYLKYLDFSVINELKYIEFGSHSYSGLNPLIVNMIQSYINEPKVYETLQNTKRYDLLAMFISNPKLKECAMTMCKCNKKYIDDNFVDYLENLVSNNEDTKNIQVVCPPREKYYLKAVEQENKYRRRRDKEELEKTISEYTEPYLERTKALQNVDFGNEIYSVKILKDIQDFYKTAEHFGNCVYRMNYYKEEKSYIFKIVSRVDDIEELTELKLRDKLEINQCYGKNNLYTNKHEEIVNLLKSKLDEIEGIICQK